MKLLRVATDTARQWSGVAVSVDDLTKVNCESVKYVYSGDDDHDIAVTDVTIIIAYFTV